MAARPWTGPNVAPRLIRVTIMRETLAGPSGAVCFVAALRWLWLLPDWLAKWQSLVAHRRGSRRRDHADSRSRTTRARMD
jgi:hypothetical protein